MELETGLLHEYHKTEKEKLKCAVPAGKLAEQCPPKRKLTMWVLQAKNILGVCCISS